MEEERIMQVLQRLDSRLAEKGLLKESPADSQDTEAWAPRPASSARPRRKLTKKEEIEALRKSVVSVERAMAAMQVANTGKTRKRKSKRKYMKTFT